jgi:RNA polymerase sigma factor for flagellar operon FliA
MNGHAMYAEVENLGEKDQIVRHASLVKRIAYHLLNRLPPTVQIDDLIQAGMVGLLEAASNFDADMGASFETIENETGEDAKDSDVALALGISLGDYHQILIDSSSSRIYSIDTMEENTQDAAIPSSSEITPEEALSHDEYRRQLTESIRQLPEKEQLVMSLYYDDELNFREIGEILDVTESRICQLHGQALLRVKARMSDWNSHE